MNFKNVFYITAIFLLTFAGCGGGESAKTPNSGIKIRLSRDSSSVELYNIPSNITEELRRDSLGTNQWKDFFAVYEDTTDKEMRDFQNALDGLYSVKGTSVEFVPEIKFKSGKSYFARCYTKDILEEPEDLISRRDLTPSDSYLEFKFKIK